MVVIYIFFKKIVQFSFCEEISKKKTFYRQTNKLTQLSISRHYDFEDHDSEAASEEPHCTL